MNKAMIGRASRIQRVTLAAAGVAIAVLMGAGLLGAPGAQAQAAASDTAAPAVRERAKPGARFPQGDDYYPAPSQRLGETGTVVLRACVGSGGRLTAEPAIAASSGFPRLDAGALKIAKAADGRYEPATENGQPVESCFYFPVTFVLYRAESAPMSPAPGIGILIVARKHSLSFGYGPACGPAVHCTGHPLPGCC